MGRYTRAGNFLLAGAFLTSGFAAEFRVLDVQRVPVTGDPSQAVVHGTVPVTVPEISCDVLVAGAGMGGVGAALAISGRGHSVCLTEETDWVGGQATSGGVSALDENRFIEFSGATRGYRQFRDGIRDWYRANTKLTTQAASRQNLNPGSCYVSALCFEPKVGVSVLDQMLRKPGINVYRRTAIVALERHGGTIASALAWQFEQRRMIRFRIRFVLDATEMGDLLPLAKVPYTSGAEAKSETGEPDAPEKSNPSCVQSFTYPFAIEHSGRAGALARKLPDYEQILQRQGFSLQVNYPAEFGWKGQFRYHMFGNEPPVPNNMSPGAFFPWRRLLDSRNFQSGVPRDVALMNWPRQDYAAESPLDREPDELAAIFQRAKQTSSAFLYWLQHDVARDAQEQEQQRRGYPELTMRSDVMGTDDGLSKYPYIRESRRMIARGSVREQDIVDYLQTGARSRKFDDSVGTGFYMVDIHPCGANEHGRMRMPKPFQIPMSALLPKEPLNFLPAGKNLGVTHLTNGAFRLHPIEWNVGEAAGTIASLELELGVEPPAATVQRELAHGGVPMVWFDDLELSHPAFEAIQLAALRGQYPVGTADLHASPDAPVSRGEVAAALLNRFGKAAGASGIGFVIEAGWMAADHRNWFHQDLPFYWADLREERLPTALAPVSPTQTGPVRRWEFAMRMMAR